jgi:hypothetical protein
MKLYIANSMIQGKGIFASSKINTGEKIYTLSGKQVGKLKCVWFIVLRKIKRDSPLQIGEGEYLIVDEFSNYFNHSCEPNAGICGISELFALRDISEGEEITFDYSMTVSPSIVSWSMKCKCGSNKCRKKVGNILTVPKEALREYISKGAIQDYMKRLIDYNGEGL